MKKHPTLLLAIGAVCIVCTAAIADYSLQASIVSDCAGKPYGTPGCPLKASYNSSVPATCGNGQLNEGEECDLGAARNGASNCTKGCKLLYCGDGLISPALKEECEPESQEVYGVDPKTGELVVETQYLAPSCGAVCSVPVCDNDGRCSGGCKYVFLPACTASATGAISTQEQVEEFVKPSATIPLQQTTTTAPVPVTSNCGNGRIDAGEQCDDGNQINEDACTTSCRLAVCGDGLVQAWEQCDDGNLVDADSCSNSCRSPACGDGVVQLGEQCDDGNFIDTDSCTSACKIPICGDRIVQPSLGEECDDGNSIDNDNCTNFCRRPSCGDGVLQKGEECDDGNRNDFDSCTNACIGARCGDGVLQVGEECDDGNRVNHDGCNNLCKLPVCGNGVREGEESCDDGNDNDGDSCTTRCTKPTCGDGLLQAGEFCDDGNQNDDDNCTSKCRVPTCGDGLLHPREECDQGHLNSDSKPDSCRSDCRLPVCGDGVTDRNEECDGGEACSPECKILRPAAALLQNGFPALPYVIGLGGFGLIAVAAYVFKRQLHKVVAHVAGEKVADSIDDVPLDQIEMPWLKN